jgi:hypothetical protein
LPECGPFQFWQVCDVLYYFLWLWLNLHGLSYSDGWEHMWYIWDIYIVIFRKMGFRQEEGVRFLGVEKCFYFFHTLDQPICIPRCYVVYMNYFTNFLSMVVIRLVSVLICSAFLEKIVS